MSVKQRGNTKNLKPQWPKGVSGNPKGRPKVGQSLAELLRQKGEDEGANDAIAEAVVEKAKTGDIAAAKLYWERGYGMAPQTIDMTTNVHSETVERVMALTRDFFLKKAPNLAAEYLEYMAK